MKLTCDSKELRKKVKMVAAAALDKAPDVNGVVWTTIKLTAVQGSLEISGGQPEATVVTRMPADVTETGTTMILASALADTVAYFDEPRTSIELMEKQLHLKCGDFKKAVTLMTGEFPILETDLPEDSVEVLFNLFNKAVEGVMECAEKDGARPVLGALNIEFFPGGQGAIRITATDGFRLGTTVIAMGKVSEPMKNRTALVPARHTGELLQKWEGAETVRIALKEKRVLIGTKDTVVSLGRVEGVFPDFTPLVKPAPTVRVAVGLPAMVKGLDFGKLINKQGDLEFRAGKLGDQFVVVRNKDQGGTSEARIPVHAEGTDLQVYLNLQLLRDSMRFASRMGYENAVINAVSPNLAVRVEPIRDATKDVDKPHAMFLVMPAEKPN